MKLLKIEINNYRSLENVVIDLESTSFLIGANNQGKSTVLDAIEFLVTGTKPSTEDFRILSNNSREENLSVIGHFKVSAEESLSRGLKGRCPGGIFVYKVEANLSNEKVEVSFYAKTKPIKAIFSRNTLLSSIIDEVITLEMIQNALGNQELQLNYKLKDQDIDNLTLSGEEFCFEENVDEEWFKNPGGFRSIVSSKFPEFIKIPSIVDFAYFDADKDKQLLGKCISILVKRTLNNDTEIYSKLRSGVDELFSILNNTESDSGIPFLTSQINNEVKKVFPASQLTITPKQDQTLEQILAPKYDVTLSSTTNTKVGRQGTGLIRTVVYSILKTLTIHNLNNSATNVSSLESSIILAFEEPEIYLHPSAINLLKESLYELAENQNLKIQTICTTHSPLMIDLSKPLQSLTRLYQNTSGSTQALNLGLSSALDEIIQDNRRRIKMLNVFDSEISKLFYANRIVIVEGPTEVILLNKVIELYEEDKRRKIMSSIYILNSHGKKTIISIIKYLVALKLNDFVVLHDKDNSSTSQTTNDSIREAFNPQPSIGRIFISDPTVENEAGYQEPSSEKPFAAYVHSSTWSTLNDVPSRWRTICDGLFGI